MLLRGLLRPRLYRPKRWRNEPDHIRRFGLAGSHCRICAFLRPVLRALPAFQQFYAEADGFWQKVWALCGKSATLAFAFLVQAVSWVLQWIDPIASFLGDPDFRQQLTEALQANPKVLGYVLMGVWRRHYRGADEINRLESR